MTVKLQSWLQLLQLGCPHCLAAAMPFNETVQVEEIWVSLIALHSR